jgi:hypothetical protein
LRPAEKRAVREFDAEPTAARHAREFVGATCRAWGLGAAAETAQLLTSELVTNGVLHARTSLSLEMFAEANRLVVSLHDDDPQPPAPRGRRQDLLADIDELLGRGADDVRGEPDLAATMQVGPAGSIVAGRGLLIVDALATEWGVQQACDGKSIWFRLEV